MNSFFSQLPFKRHLEEVASVGIDLRFALNSTPGWQKDRAEMAEASLCATQKATGVPHLQENAPP